MKDPLRHSWNLSSREAISLQKILCRKVRLRPRVRLPRTVAGVDISYPRFGRRAVAGVILLSFPELRVLEEAFAAGEMRFPYIPGLLSFREGPLMERAFRKLRKKPDLVFFDGQGIAHPRGLGLAAHLGLRWGVSAIGCGKSRLFGDGPEPADRRGAWAALLGTSGERVGVQLRTRQGVKPIFVSQGHRVSLEQAIDWVMEAAPRYRLPEPIRQAHRRTNEERRKRGIVR